MSNIPEVDFNVPSILAKAEYLKLRFNYHNSIDIRQTVSGHNEYQKNVSDILQRLEKKETAVTILELRDIKKWRILRADE